MIRQLLSDWGMSEEIITKFIDEEIDDVVLKYLDKEMIESLIPKVGPRIKFTLKWKEWLKNNTCIELTANEKEKNQFVASVCNIDHQESTKERSSDLEIIADLNLPVIDIKNNIRMIPNEPDQLDQQENMKERDNNLEMIADLYVPVMDITGNIEMIPNESDQQDQQENMKERSNDLEMIADLNLPVIDIASNIEMIPNESDQQDQQENMKERSNDLEMIADLNLTVIDIASNIEMIPNESDQQDQQENMKERNNDLEIIADLNLPVIDIASNIEMIPNESDQQDQQENMKERSNDLEMIADLNLPVIDIASNIEMIPNESDQQDQQENMKERNNDLEIIADLNLPVIDIASNIEMIPNESDRQDQQENMKERSNDLEMIADLNLPVIDIASNIEIVPNGPDQQDEQENMKERSNDLEIIADLNLPVIDIASNIEMIPNESDQQDQQEDMKERINDLEMIADLNLPVIDIASNVEVIPNESDTANNIAIFPSTSTIINSKAYNLKQILSQTTQGKKVLSFYKKNGELNDSLRNRIADCILSDELAADVSKRITMDRLIFLAENIIKLFPEEHMITWVQKCKRNGTTILKGKLLDGYYNIRRSISRVLDKSRARCSRYDCIINNENIEVQDYSQDIRAHLEWLQCNVQPWPKVISSWKATSKARLEQLIIREKGKQRKIPTIHDYMLEYPALNSPMGYSLMEIDFEKLYPSSVLKFYYEWPKLFNFILKKLQNDATIAQEQFTREHDTVPVIMLLSRLFPVHTVIKQKRINQWRPSQQEITEGFILHLKDYADIQSALDIKRKKLQNFNLTLQPQVIIVGPTLKYIYQNIVVINDVLYKIETTLKAIDITFKAFQALHANYPVESERIWLFLQKAIYNIETEWDKQEATVNVLVEEYRAS